MNTPMRTSLREQALRKNLITLTRSNYADGDNNDKNCDVETDEFGNDDCLVGYSDEVMVVIVCARVNTVMMCHVRRYRLVIYPFRCRPLFFVITHCVTCRRLCIRRRHHHRHRRSFVFFTCLHGHEMCFAISWHHMFLLPTSPADHSVFTGTVSHVHLSV